MIKKAPINFKLVNPMINTNNWEAEAPKWIALNKQVNGNPYFEPLTIKGAYVVGVIYTICKSVEILLRGPNDRTITYFPAYGVSASAIELLGRCIGGNPSANGCTKDLKTGFQWLASSNFDLYKNDYKKVPPEFPLVQTM